MASRVTSLGFTFTATTIDVLRGELNRFVALLASQIDQMRGVRGTPTFETAPDVKGNRIQNLGKPEQGSDAQRFDLCLASDGNRFNAQGKPINHVGNGSARDDAATFGQLEDATKRSGDLFVSTSVPQTIDAGDVGDPGSGTGVSAQNHQHGVNTALDADVVAVGTAAAAGTSLKVPRADHVHPLGRPFSIVATGSLPAAGAGMDQTILIENTGTGLNLVIYGAGIRARLTGIGF